MKLNTFIASFLTILASQTFTMTTASTIPPHLTPHQPAQLPLTPELIYQFPSIPTWIENLAVRENGDILLTLLSDPKIYTVNPTTKESKTVTTIPGKTSLFAIAELGKDEFFVSAGNFSITTGSLEPGSFALFKVCISFSHPHHHSENDKSAAKESFKVSKVVDLPDALLVNGMAALKKEQKVLVPDSYLGVIFVVDVEKGVVSHTIDLPEFHSSVEKKVGINGIKLFKEYLYFTVSTPPALYRIKFDTHTAQPAAGAKVEKIATDAVFMDDFAIDERGRAWIATNAGNVVVLVDGEKEGQINGTVVAGKKGTLEVGGPTAVAFGRGMGMEGKLFIVTSGGLGGGLDAGVAPEGGKIIAVDVRDIEIR